MKIPTDYSAIFKNKVIVIIGMSRSGTSILGKLIGSMAKTLYLYEPAICKYGLQNDASIMPAILFEDYFLPQFQGRNLNYSKLDQSYCLNYFHGDMTRPWQCNDPSYSGSRKESLDLLKWDDFKFIIKTNESQPYLPQFRAIFEGCQFIHIVRKKEDIIKSTLKQGWYTDQAMNILVDWVKEKSVSIFEEYNHWKLFDSFRNTKVEIPWFIENEDLWLRSDIKGRINQVYDNLINYWDKLKMEKDCIEIRYEDLCSMPETIADHLAKAYNLQRTEITDRHIKSIKEYKK